MLLSEIFLSTLSLRRATLQTCQAENQSPFLSTLSLRRATLNCSRNGFAIRYFYPRSPCGERLPPQAFPFAACVISIHALLAESDCGPLVVSVPVADFYPRSPCGERRLRYRALSARLRFLSTLSLRRATLTVTAVSAAGKISIHALLAESDMPRLTSSDSFALFLSTLSLRRATCISLLCGGRSSYFYPRSPCGERRCVKRFHAADISYFYPRSPCGERHNADVSIGLALAFLSTLSLRRATHILASVAVALSFLSTLSLRRATTSATATIPPLWNFYPRSPCGERLWGDSMLMRWYTFLSTLSLRRATAEVERRCAENSHFYPRSPCGERPIFRA